jgi:CheY-like chemotaxis protein
MGKLVMVIDDSSTVRNIIANCLGNKGFTVHGFSDGVEAMHWLTQPEAQVPDLIILDISLPKMDGYEVARRLKSKPQFSDTIIVMLSRHDGMIDKLKARLVGAKDYLSKPFSTRDIIAVTESHLGVQ